jgi:hypothetical protein
MAGSRFSESGLIEGVEAKDERLVAEARGFLGRHRDDDPESWSLLGEYEDERGGVTVAFAILGPDGPGPDTDILAGRRADGRWMVCSAGPCFPEPVLAGDRRDMMWVNVQAPDAGIDREAKVVGVRVVEAQCTGSRDPRPFLHEPVVVESETDVTVYWTSTPPGAATCPGNSPFPVELTLPSPLGDRTLLDGSMYPPREIG